MRTIILALMILLAGSLTYGQAVNSLLRKGNRAYEKKDYSEAEKNYRRALEKDPNSEKGQFNLGTAVYQNKNFQEAAAIYGSMAEGKSDREIRSKAMYNLGNSYLEQKDYQNSINAYKRSLLEDPANEDARYNLEYAKMMLKKQQQQQQQDQKDKNDQKKDSEDKKKDQPQDPQQKQQQDQQQNKQPDPKKISKEDADRMLEALKNDEKKTLQKLKKQKARVQVIGIEKDW